MTVVATRRYPGSLRVGANPYSIDANTGPRTPAGLARSKRARWKYRRFSAEARQEMEHFRELLRECKEIGALSFIVKDRAGCWPETGEGERDTHHTAAYIGRTVNPGKVQAEADHRDGGD